MSSVSRKSPWSVTTAVRVSPAERLTYEAARQMGHWFWLAQPSTIPETLIGRDPDLYVRHIVEQWDGADAIERDAVEEYIRCMRKPEVLRTMGAKYEPTGSISSMTRLAQTVGCSPVADGGISTGDPNRDI